MSPLEKEHGAVVTDTSLNVALPEALKNYLGSVGSPKGPSATRASMSGTLIRKDRERRAGARLEALLLEGLDFGDPQPLDAAEWQAIRQEARERIGGPALSRVTR